MGAGLMLIALALGYKAYVDATKEKDGLRILGQVIGIVIMLTAVCGFICSSVMCMKRGGCPLESEKKWGSKMCHVQEGADADDVKNICPVKGPMSDK